MTLLDALLAAARAPKPVAVAPVSGYAAYVAAFEAAEAEVVFEDMWESDQGALECSEEGCWISPEQIEACLERLGYVYCEDEMTWRPEGETEPA